MKNTTATRHFARLTSRFAISSMSLMIMLGAGCDPEDADSASEPAELAEESAEESAEELEVELTNISHEEATHDLAINGGIVQLPTGEQVKLSADDLCNSPSAHARIPDGYKAIPDEDQEGFLIVRDRDLDGDAPFEIDDLTSTKITKFTCSGNCNTGCGPYSSGNNTGCTTGCTKCTYKKDVVF